MTPPPSEKSGLAKDLIVILGLPALLLRRVPVSSPRPWSDTAAADVRVAVYDISEHTAFYIRGHLRYETRTTASGKDVV